MYLFNASSLFDETAEKEMLHIIHDPEKLRKMVIGIKEKLLELYHFEAYQLPEDFTSRSYIIAANHLTDSDAPLIMSYYHQIMHSEANPYPVLFIFAKENCFNGVSIPKELLPLLEQEEVFPVDRTSVGGSMAAIRAAEKWFHEGEQPKHFLIFAQGTIYDINKDKAEDIERGAFWLAKLLEIPVLPVFLEQAVEGEKNRMICGEPMVISKDCRDLDAQKQIWMDRVIAAQNALEGLTGVPAREAVLDKEHQTRKHFKSASVKETV